MDFIVIRITALIMALQLLFAGLTGKTEYNSGIFERYSLPAFSEGTPEGTYESSGETVIARYENIQKKHFEAYVHVLRLAGFSFYDTNTIDTNRFATLYRGDTAVFLSWFGKGEDLSSTGTFRIIAEPKSSGYPLKESYKRVCDTLLTGMRGETVVANEGMGYIIRLEDGSFCIIDSGMGDPDHVDSNKLMNILLSQKPAGEGKPVIAAWIFTHLHGDHIGVFNCFSLDHHDDVVIERFYFNFPKDEEIRESDSPYMFDDTIYRYNQFRKNFADFYSSVPVVKLHSGNRFAVRNVTFETLYAYDDYYPKTILNGGMNENSLLLKMTVGNQSILWTGDFAFGATELVLSEYTDALSADILQMAHHGINGTVEFYSKVDPTYALLPVWNGGLGRMLSYQQNKWLVNSPKLKQMIVTGCGTWTIRLPYAPKEGTFERIPTDSTVYPSYPTLLGE